MPDLEADFRQEDWSSLLATKGRKLLPIFILNTQIGFQILNNFFLPFSFFV